MSLARLRVKQMRTTEARDLVAFTLARFEEGFETADLMAARNFVNRLPKYEDPKDQAGAAACQFSGPPQRRRPQ